MMKKLLGGISALALSASLSLAATLLPNGKQVFLDGNGSPLAGGFVTFYAPGTTTPKATWRDPGQTTQNQNPIVLDSNGSAIIYGAGAYRQIVQDAGGNVIWDQLTADTSSSTESWGGTSLGTANAQIVSASNFTSSDGQIIWFKAGATNTNSMTLTPTTGGSPVLVVADTLTGPTSLKGGEVVAGNIVGVVYDRTAGVFHLTNYLKGSASATLDSASSMDLGTAGSNIITINGSTTITGFGSSATLNNPLYNLYFPSGLTITLGASLSGPSLSGSIVLSAKSFAQALYLGSGAWRILSYTQGTEIATVPAGQVSAFYLASCPAGWRAADGTSSTPDLRGYFVRGLDTGGSVDSGRTLGSYQGDQLQDHAHNVPLTTVGSSATTTANGGASVATAQLGTSNPTSGNHGSETRPKNIALLYCVKN